MRALGRMDELVRVLVELLGARGTAKPEVVAIEATVVSGRRGMNHHATDRVDRFLVP